jgi:hypothetical protein
MFARKSARKSGHDGHGHDGQNRVCNMPYMLNNITIKIIFYYYIIAPETPVC